MSRACWSNDKWSVMRGIEAVPRDGANAKIRKAGGTRSERFHQCQGLWTEFSIHAELLMEPRKFLYPLESSRLSLGSLITDLCHPSPPLWFSLGPHQALEHPRAIAASGSGHPASDLLPHMQDWSTCPSSAVHPSPGPKTILPLPPSIGTGTPRWLSLPHLQERAEWALYHLGHQGPKPGTTWLWNSTAQESKVRKLLKEPSRSFAFSPVHVALGIMPRTQRAPVVKRPESFWS